MKQTLYPVLLFLLVIASCSGGAENDRPETSGDLTLSETAEIDPLRDDLRLMETITTVIPAGDDLVIADESPGVALFRDHEMVRSYGSVGPGPCEYERIATIDVSDDTLYVLSSSQSKIIAYNIKTGECLGETNHPMLTSQGYLKRSNGYFYTARLNYNSYTPDSTRLLFRLDDNERSSAYPLALESVDAVNSPIGVLLPGRNFGQIGDILYTYFPMTGEVILLDTGSGEVDSFPIQIELAREEMEKAGNDMRQISEVIQNQMEFVWRLLASDHWLVLSMLQQNGPEEAPDQWLQFYSAEGRFLKQVSISNLEQPVAVKNQQILFVRESTDPSAGYAYELVYRDVMAE